MKPTREQIREILYNFGDYFFKEGITSINLFNSLIASKDIKNFLSQFPEEPTDHELTLKEMLLKMAGWAWENNLEFDLEHATHIDDTYNWILRIESYNRDSKILCNIFSSDKSKDVCICKAYEQWKEIVK